MSVLGGIDPRRNAPTPGGAEAHHEQHRQQRNQDDVRQPDADRQAMPPPKENTVQRSSRQGDQRQDDAIFSIPEAQALTEQRRGHEDPGSERRQL